MDNYRSIGRCVSVLNRYSNIYFSEALCDLNIHGSGQLRIVLALAKCESGVTQDELAKGLLVDKGSISRMIRPLIRNGIVERKRNPEDHRAYVIRLTGFAKEKLPDIKERARKWTEILSRDFTQEDTDMLFSLFDKIERNAANHVKGTIE